MTTTAHDSTHDAHEHPKFLAHHFDTPVQQFDSGKLGVWLFLTTEILLFSGLFCAYAVYRATHPEIFAYAHLYLNKIYGAVNTIVLIFSSFTMAWAVRASQMGEAPFILKIPKGKNNFVEVWRISHRKLCVLLLTITIGCGFIFMGIKGVEYSDKWREHLLPGPKYSPTEMPGEKAPAAGEAHAESEPAAAVAVVAPAKAPGTTRTAENLPIEQSEIPKAAVGPTGVDPDWAKTQGSQFKKATVESAGEKSGPEPANTHIFFGIYFLMTGLHGIHVLAGMGLIFWVLLRTNRGDFGPEYFSPVDFVGLYWHIVDLVWIFLFPLLYLIGNSQ